MIHQLCISNNHKYQNNRKIFLFKIKFLMNKNNNKIKIKKIHKNNKANLNSNLN